MSCCDTAIANLFDRTEAERQLRRYHNDGPEETTQALIDVVAKQGVSGATLLDIGGGVGAIYHALLERGAARATHVDISSAYLEVARNEAEQRGVAAKVEWRNANFVDVAESIPNADVVTLDRVICCYPDMDRLVAASAQHARRVWGAVYPRERTWTRFAIRMHNVWRSVIRDAFRVYVHSPEAIAALLARQGFQQASVQRTFFWEVAVFVRSA